MKKIIVAASAMMISSSLLAGEVNFNELRSTEGTALVVVKQVVANDAAGEPRFLFEDAAGAVMTVQELSQVDEIMSAKQIGQQGQYCNLHVILDELAFVVNKDQVQSVNLKPGIDGTVLRLAGRLQVSRNFVGTNTDFTVVDTNTRLAAGKCGRING